MDRCTARPPLPAKHASCENSAMRASLLVAACLIAACSGPPKRDVFIPPYAEKGCWAQFYAQTDFGPPMRQVEGPTYVEAIPGAVVEIADLRKMPPHPLFGEARSLVVGPNAQLV